METRKKSELTPQNDLPLNEAQPAAETQPANEVKIEETTVEAAIDEATEAAAEVAVADQATVAEVETAEAVADDARESVADVAREFAEDTAEAADAEEVAEEDVRTLAAATKAEAIAMARALAVKEADEIGRDEMSRLKQQFYALHNAEIEKAREAFIEAGNAPDAFEPAADAEEEEFKAIFNEIKEKKNARAAEIEAEQLRNFESKEALIAELQSLGGDIDNVNRQFPRFREIQQEFKAIGDVNPQRMTDQWKRYQDAVEHFYDQLKVNNELRDYDFKKNLETKTLLCEEAEALANEADIVTAFRRLQELHIKWRETGPVAKEIREEIWTRFKDASAVINKKYQTFFEERKAREQANEAAKTAICERVEALDFDSLKSFNAWNAMTRTILEAQDDWKKLGFASKKANNALFARFRATCDKFFTLKAEYYRSVKDDLAANLARKTALCEQAEALQDSTDWKATAEKLVALQKEWKTIGAVPKKQSDAIWTRFQTACDKFFESKKKDLNDSRHAEQANLKAKRAVVAQLREIPADMPREQVLTAISEARTAWGDIGHVPFREKDKVYEEFRAAINDLYKAHDLRGSREHMARFETNISEITDAGKLSRERERLARALEQKRADLATYENNLGFFNFKSASASSMLKDIERKTQRIKDDIAELEEKIRMIDDKA